jgi:hypothetical protein
MKFNMHACMHTNTNTQKVWNKQGNSNNFYVLTECKHYITHLDIKIPHTFSKGSVTRLANPCFRIIHVFQARLEAAAL